MTAYQFAISSAAVAVSAVCLAVCAAVVDIRAAFRPGLEDAQETERWEADKERPTFDGPPPPADLLAEARQLAHRLTQRIDDNGHPIDREATITALLDLLTGDNTPTENQ